MFKKYNLDHKKCRMVESENSVNPWIKYADIVRAIHEITKTILDKQSSQTMTGVEFAEKVFLSNNLDIGKYFYARYDEHGRLIPYCLSLHAALGKSLYYDKEHYDISHFHTVYTTPIQPPKED